MLNQAIFAVNKRHLFLSSKLFIEAFSKSFAILLRKKLKGFLMYSHLSPVKVNCTGIENLYHNHTRIIYLSPASIDRLSSLLYFTERGSAVVLFAGVSC